MNCPNCQAPITPRHKFCVECGTPVNQPTQPESAPEAAAPKEPLPCSHCGAALASAAKFCTKCGTPVQQPTTSQTVTPAPQTPAVADVAQEQPAPQYATPPEEQTLPADQAPVAQQQPAPQATDAAPQATDAAPQAPRIDDLRPVLVPIEYKYISEKVLVLKNPEKHTYLEMSVEDVPYLHYLNGQYAVADIVKLMYEQTGKMAFKKFYNLLMELYANEFLYPQGMEALAQSAAAAGTAKSNPVEQMAAVLDRPIVTLPFLGAIAQFGATPMSVLMNMPAQIAVFVLCVAPVVLVSLLASLKMDALEPLLNALGIFAAPNQKGYNIFMFRGSYMLGLILAYASAFTVLSLRSAARAATLHRFGCEIVNPCLRCWYGIFYLDVDGRDILMADRKSRMIYHAAGITSTLIIGTIINIIQNLLGFSHPLYLVYLIAFMITFVNLCVFYRSDLFQIIDNYFEIPNLMKHVSTYVTKKFFRQILNFKSSFTEEKSLTTIACCGLVWLYLAVSVFFGFLRDNVALLMNALGDAGSVLDKLAIAVFLVNIVGPFVMLMAGFLMLVLRNLAGVAAEPVGRWYRRLTAKKGREAVDPEQITGFLQGIPLFMALAPHERLGLAAQLQKVHFKPGQNVVVQGDSGDAFYVILDGVANVVVETPSGMQMTVDTLKAGDSFGEIALLEDVPRTATVRATEPLAVLELPRDAFDAYLAQSEEARQKITDVIRLTSLLQKNPFFQELPPARITEIIGLLRPLPVAQEQAVIREGDGGDLFYIISEGSFQVLKNAPDGSQQFVARLGKNESFGEIALINNVPRTSSVVAETPGALLTLRRDEFLAVANASIHAGLVLEQETEKRMAALAETGS